LIRLFVGRMAQRDHVMFAALLVATIDRLEKPIAVGEFGYVECFKTCDDRLRRSVGLFTLRPRRRKECGYVPQSW
jgi:hypothetical protein